MNRKGKTVHYLSAFLIIVFLSASIYVYMPDKVKLVVENTNSKFYVWEDDSWVLGATEYVNLFDGTKKMRASSRSVIALTDGDLTTITRFATWKDNITTTDTYTFNSDVEDVELFPISHSFKCVNCVGKIVHFEYRDILYEGITRPASSPERFGHNIVVEWEQKHYYSKVFQQSVASDKLIIRYRPTLDSEVFSVRLFDPVVTTWSYQETANSTSITTEGSGSGKRGFLNVNYTKIPSASNNSLWEIKFSTEARQNVSIPATCWALDPVQLRIYSQFGSSGTGNASAECYNGSDWITVHAGAEDTVSCSLSASNSNRMYDGDWDTGVLYDSFNGAWKTGDGSCLNIYIYEEAMWWRSDNLSIDLLLQGLNQSLDVELGSLINASANLGAETVCIDVNHPSYGVNFSCGLSNTSFIINITSFRKIVFNDSTTSKTLAFNSGSNETIHIPAHQYDELVNVTINVSGLQTNNTFPTNVKIYVNNTLSNSLGDVFNTTNFEVSTFNDSTSIKNTSFTGSETNLAGHIRIPKNANVTSAVLTIRSDDTIETQLSFPSRTEAYIVLEASNVSEDNFTYYNVTTWNYTDPFSGEKRWLVNSSNPDNDMKRVEIITSLFYGDGTGIGSNNEGRNYLLRSSVVEGLSKISTSEIKDKGKDVVYREIVATSVAVGTQAENGKSNNLVSSSDVYNNCSIWGFVRSTGDGGASTKDGVARVYQNTTNPNAKNLLMGVNSNVNPGTLNVSTFGTDTTSTEKNNVTAMRLYLSHSGNPGVVGEAQARGLSICGAGVWSDDITTFLDVDETRTLSSDFEVDGLSNWTNYMVRDVWVRVGPVNGTKEFEMSGYLNHTNSTQDFNNSVKNFLSTCTADSDGFCDLPIYLFSSTEGFVEISNISINYTAELNPVTLNKALLEGFLNNSFNYTNIPITFSSDSNGSLIVSGLEYDYAGGNYTFEVLAHTPSYSVNQSYNLTYHHSDWGFSFPKYVDYLEFIPRSRDDQNVTPYRQNSFTPIFNVTSQSYGSKTFNFSIFINESFSCVNMTANTEFNKSSGVGLINSSWVNTSMNVDYLDELDIWLWADYDCNFTTWRIWQPLISLRACCTDCDVCSIEP